MNLPAKNQPLDPRAPHARLLLALENNDEASVRQIAAESDDFGALAHELDALLARRKRSELLDEPAPQAARCHPYSLADACLAPRFAETPPFSGPPGCPALELLFELGYRPESAELSNMLARSRLANARHLACAMLGQPEALQSSDGFLPPAVAAAFKGLEQTDPAFALSMARRLAENPAWPSLAKNASWIQFLFLDCPECAAFLKNRAKATPENTGFDTLSFLCRRISEKIEIFDPKNYPKEQKEKCKNIQQTYLDALRELLDCHGACEFSERENPFCSLTAHNTHEALPFVRQALVLLAEAGFDPKAHRCQWVRKLASGFGRNSAKLAEIAFGLNAYDPQFAAETLADCIPRYGASAGAKERLAKIYADPRFGAGRAALEAPALIERHPVLKAISARKFVTAMRAAELTGFPSAAFQGHNSAHLLALYDKPQAAAFLALLLSQPGWKGLAGKPSDPGADTFASNTPLMIAARKANLSAAELLCAAGCDPNASDKAGYTALHFICQKCCHRTADKALPIVKALLDAGADPSLATKKGVTPIELAAKKSDPETFRILAERFPELLADQKISQGVNAGIAGRAQLPAFEKIILDNAGAPAPAPACPKKKSL